MYRRSLVSWFGCHWEPLHETATAVPAAGAGGAGGAPSGGSPSGGSPPSSPAGSGSSSAGASGQPGSGSGSPASPANQGPVPWDRFNEVNTKYGALSWAEGLDKDRVDQASRLYDWFDQDPEGAYEYLTGLMKRQNRLPAAAAAPAAPRNYPADQSTGRPLPDRIISETGEQLYSAQQTGRLIDWAMERLEQRLKPLESLTGNFQARSEAQQAIAEAEASWPYFKDHVEAIFTELNKDKRLSLEGAYRRVVMPKIRQLERETVLTEMRTRSNASTTNPASASAPQTEDLTKLPLRELLRREMTKRGFTKA